jgi:transcriptional regulator with XRE-family HTH domain
MRREELGISRKDLASRAGISYPFLSEIEKGTKQPSSKKLGQLAGALELGTEELVTISKRLGAIHGESSSILTTPEPQASGPVGRPDTASAGNRSGNEAWHLGGSSTGRPEPIGRAPALTQRAIQDEIRGIVENAVSDTLRIWSRDVLPLLVEREIQRALDAERASEGR